MVYFHILIYLLFASHTISVQVSYIYTQTKHFTYDIYLPHFKWNFQSFAAIRIYC